MWLCSALSSFSAVSVSRSGLGATAATSPFRFSFGSLIAARLLSLRFVRVAAVCSRALLLLLCFVVCVRRRCFLSFCLSSGFSSCCRAAASEVCSPPIVHGPGGRALCADLPGMRARKDSMALLSWLLCGRAQRCQSCCARIGRRGVAGFGFCRCVALRRSSDCDPGCSWTGAPGWSGCSA